MSRTDFDEDTLAAVTSGQRTLTAEEREYLVTDTRRFEECQHNEAQLRAMADAELLRTALWVWAEYAWGQF